MARHRRKTRTHAKNDEDEKVPRSMVISLGELLKSHSLTQLVADVRMAMQPHTAINLRERKANKIKDFIVMAGPLGVSHLLVFHQSDTGNVNLRLSRLPRGPSITFRVKNYSLCKDIQAALKHPKIIGKDSLAYLNPPLLVLNGFTAPSKAEAHEKLTITLLQSMFPPITPQNMRVSSIQRVLMLNKNEDGEIDLRHYLISTKAVDLLRPIRKIVNHRVPNLAKVSDIADFVSDPYGGGFTSESEVEDDAVVRVEESVKRSEEKKTQKKSVKLTEIGPRIKLELLKIEDEVIAGKVLYHSKIEKSQLEINKLDQKHAVRRKLREKRRREQEENVKQKKQKKEAKKLRRKMRKEGENGENGEESGASDGGSDGDSEKESGSDSDRLFSDDE